MAKIIDGSEKVTQYTDSFPFYTLWYENGKSVLGSSHKTLNEAQEVAAIKSGQLGAGRGFNPTVFVFQYLSDVSTVAKEVPATTKLIANITNH